MGNLTSGWSAALAFAPVRRPNQKTKSAAPRIPVGASVITAPATANVSTTAVISSIAVVYSAPVLNTPKAAAAEDGGDGALASAAATTQGWGKKVKPPSMVLDEDVNGFKTSQHQKKKHHGGKGKNKKVRLSILVYPLPCSLGIRTKIY